MKMFSFLLSDFPTFYAFPPGQKPFKLSNNHCVSVFEDIVIHPNRYVKNEVSNRSFQRKLELRDFFQRPVRGAWSDFSTMANIANVNAYYNQATNTMVVPIGMLQPPLFWTRPKSLTFGAFGIVVGKWALVSPFSKIYRSSITIVYDDGRSHFVLWPPFISCFYGKLQVAKDTRECNNVLSGMRSILD